VVEGVKISAKRHRFFATSYSFCKRAVVGPDIQLRELVAREAGSPKFPDSRSSTPVSFFSQKVMMMMMELRAINVPSSFRQKVME
jgi:hypothetical protein